MEHRPNSRPDKGENYFKLQSSDIGPDDDKQSFPLTEFITIYNATKIWEGPRYPAYNSKAARLRSYTQWPHGMNPSPFSLSTAGFYFLGKRPVIEKIWKIIYTLVISHIHKVPLFLFQVRAI